MADDPGTQPPERRRGQRRVAPSAAGSTGERRVRADRRRQTAKVDPVPTGESTTTLEGHVDPLVTASAAGSAPAAGVHDTGLTADPDATVAWSPAAATLASMRASMPGLSAPPPPPTAEGPRSAESADERSWLPTLEDRSPDPAICPFLRAVEAGPEGRQRIVPPIESPDPANRCAALAEAVPQSLRQQELVCLTSGHVNCPRYLRGAVATPEPVVAAPRAGRNPSPAIIGSIAILVASFAASVAFVTARGGLAIDTAASARPSSSAVAEASAPPSVEPTIEVTPVPTPDVTAEPTPTPEPTAAPTPEPTPAPTPQPTPEPTPTPQPTSDRYQLLTACPDAADCWIYTIRAGDNLFSIANYFGVSLDAIYARNPWAESTPLRSGQQLRLPPPTR